MSVRPAVLTNKNITDKSKADTHPQIIFILFKIFRTKKSVQLTFCNATIICTRSEGSIKERF